MSSEMTKDEKYEYGVMVLEEFKDKGISKSEYCKANDIPVSTFNYWQDKIESESHEENSSIGRFVELKVNIDNRTIVSSDKVKDTFVPELEIAFNNINISINSTTSMDLLSSVLSEVGYVKGC